jgi:hypothetical protein
MCRRVRVPLRPLHNHVVRLQSAWRAQLLSTRAKCSPGWHAQHSQRQPLPANEIRSAMSLQCPRPQRQQTVRRRWLCCNARFILRRRCRISAWCYNRMCTGHDVCTCAVTVASWSSRSAMRRVMTSGSRPAMVTSWGDESADDPEGECPGAGVVTPRVTLHSSIRYHDARCDHNGAQTRSVAEGLLANCKCGTGQRLQLCCRVFMQVMHSSTIAPSVTVAPSSGSVCTLSFCTQVCECSRLHCNA